MKSKKTALSAAIVAALGITAGFIEPVSAAFDGLDGEYDLVILPTIVKATSYSNFKIGKDGNWQSTFTFGNLPSSISNGMTDTGALSNGNGTSIAGDGYSGILRINLSNGTFSVSSFAVDTIFATAGGDFAQHLSTDGSGTTALMSGTIDGAGNMTFTPTGRKGTINAPSIIDKRWNVDNSDPNNPGVPTSNTAWQSFSTASATSASGTINGTVLSNIGDPDGDGVDNHQGILVTGGAVSDDWGSFFEATYFETWRINLLARAINDSATVSASTARVISVLANDGLGGGGTGPLTVIGTTNGTLGTTTTDGTTVTYTAGAVGGADSFTYTTQDGNGVQSAATVNITVTTNPVAAGDDGPLNVNQGATLSTAVSNLTANDSSTAGAIVDATLTPVSPTAQGGTAIVNGTNVDYTPPSADFVGSDTYTYTVQDVAANTSDPATVSINISAYGITDAGAYAPGPVAVAAGSTSGKIGANDLPADPTVGSTCVGGCYDFVITGAANPTQIVVPELTLPISQGLVMRKNVAGTWQDYDTTTTGDVVASAPVSVNGGCPAPADASWVPFSSATATAANAGHTCLKYTIADNGAGAGPNDSDPAAGTIADPSGLSSSGQAIGKSRLQNDFNDSGCTIGSPDSSLSNRADWLLVGGLLGFLGWFRRKHKRLH